jgi:hypothetical protein
MIHSYPSIYNLGHSAIVDLLKQPVIVEEKIDGSQISFGLNSEGEVQLRSKGAQINTVAPEGMFKRAVETVTQLKLLLKPGWTYRGEYLNSPHHNALTYNRVPEKHIILFDVNTGLESYMTPEEKKQVASDLGLECVPVLFTGMIEDVEQFRNLLDTESVLGGQKIEGVVIKPVGYNLFGRDKKALLGKFVSESFREVHSKTWDAEHKTHGAQDIIQILAASYGTNARWNKAVIHLKERGELQGEPKDIGLLMKEVPEDVLKECEQEIKEDLFKWAWPQIRRKITHGLPEWYKEEMLKNAFTS